MTRDHALRLLGLAEPVDAESVRLAHAHMHALAADPGPLGMEAGHQTRLQAHLNLARDTLLADLEPVVGEPDPKPKPPPARRERRSRRRQAVAVVALATLAIFGVGAVARVLLRGGEGFRSASTAPIPTPATSEPSAASEPAVGDEGAQTPVEVEESRTPESSQDQDRAGGPTIEAAITAAESASCSTCVDLTYDRDLAEESASAGLVELSVADPQGGGAVNVWGYTGSNWELLMGYQTDVPIPARLPDRIWICTDDDNTNVRSGPGTDYSIVTAVTEDTQAKATRMILTEPASTDPDGVPQGGVSWFQVMSDGFEGWVVSSRVANQNGCQLWQAFVDSGNDQL